MSTIRTWRQVCRGSFALVQKGARIDQSGVMNILVFPLIFVTLALFAVAGLAYYEYGQSQSYKNDTDQKIAVAVAAAKDEVSQQKDKAFAEKEKSPYLVYTGPATYGSIKIQYPKTWSAYVDAPKDQSSRQLNGYFMPGQLPTLNDTSNSFALRVYIAQQAYSNVVQQYVGRQRTGAVTIQPYQSPNIPNIVGVRIDGAVANNKQGSMIILPFRDKTLQMWTESTEYKSDFDNIILPNFSLVP